MKKEIISFFKTIYPESYHIEDILFIWGIRGAEELNLFLETIRELEAEGILCTSDQEEYWYNDSSPKEKGTFLNPISDERGEESDRKTKYSKKDKKSTSDIYKRKYLGTGVFYIGEFRGSRKENGFVKLDDGQELYIPREFVDTAIHKDLVEVELLRQQNLFKKQEARVIRIVERRNEFIIGTFDFQGKFGFVTPDNERIKGDIYIPLEATKGARSGAKVVVRITAWSNGDKKNEGIIEEIVGYKGDIGLDIATIIAQHNLRTHFSDEVKEELLHVSKEITFEKNRLDLRHEMMITIDGEDAKDLDDAVHGKRLANGNYELGVHIADVSNYVRERSALDREAYKRGTSVYLVDRVLPMLPELLSNGLCSLNAHEDRYAMSCIMEINGQGTVVSYKITPSIIHVKRRCSYPEIYKALEEKLVPDDLEPCMDMVETLKDIALILMDMRKRRGAIQFEFPEYKVLLDSEGKPVRVLKRERTIAEQLIEECMLIANETVATHLKKTHKPSIYRIHEEPREEKIEALTNVLHHLGIEVPFTNSVTPQYIQNLLDSAKGNEAEQVVQIMSLRSMQQACYSEENKGHFGLASTCYTHFTSPIRRYPDLIVHRLLRQTFTNTGTDMTEDYLKKAAAHCSKCEQIATEAERETVDLKKTEYMVPYLGETFEGHISSVTAFGMFVEIDNGIDGLIPLSTMMDDHYHFEEDHFLLVGERTGRIFRLGQEVTVTLVKADVEKKQIDFVLGEVNLADLEKKPRKSTYYAKRKNSGRIKLLKNGKKAAKRNANNTRSYTSRASMKSSKGKKKKRGRKG